MYVKKEKFNKALYYRMPYMQTEEDIKLNYCQFIDNKRDSTNKQVNNRRWKKKKKMNKK